MKIRYAFSVIGALRRQIKSAVFGAIPRSRLIQRGPAASRRVALTFDDGPDHMTGAYLDLLEKLGVPATFFLVGLHCEREPELTREYVKRGHQIASHGFDHTRFPALDVRALRDQLKRTDAVLGPAVAASASASATSTWVRPPYGGMNARVLAQLLAHQRTIALWSLDPRDYETRDPADLVARCAPSVVRPGEVILMHEGQQWTLDALPPIVEGLRGAGFELVTMAEMFAA